MKSHLTDIIKNIFVQMPFVQTSFEQVSLEQKLTILPLNLRVIGKMSFEVWTFEQMLFQTTDHQMLRK